MKLPNGFGTVYKLLGNRSNPYVVKISINGKQKPIAYTKSYLVGLELLIYRYKNPKRSLITFNDIYQKFTVRKFKTVSQSTMNSDRNSFKHCRKIWEKQFTELRLSDLQSVIDDITAGYSTQKKVRNLFRQLYDYAIKYDITDKDYSVFVTIAKDNEHRIKKPFTSRQINRIKAINTEIAETVLIGCYTGLRASELLNLRSADIKIRQRYFIVTKSKTAAGTGRIIPIHDAILPIIKKRMNRDYIVNGNKLNYSQFRSQFMRFMKSLNIKHTSHEMRHTFATKLNDVGANTTSIKKLLGHAGIGITEKYYTHKNLHELRKAVNLLK